MKHSRSIEMIHSEDKSPDSSWLLGAKLTLQVQRIAQHQVAVSSKGPPGFATFELQISAVCQLSQLVNIADCGDAIAMSETADPPLAAVDEEEAELLRQHRARKRSREGSEGDTATSPSRVRPDAGPAPTAEPRSSGGAAHGSGVTPMGPPPARRRSSSNASAGSNFVPAGTPRGPTPSSRCSSTMRRCYSPTPTASQRSARDEYRADIMDQIKRAQAHNDDRQTAFWMDQLEQHSKETVRTRGRE